MIHTAGKKMNATQKLKPVWCFERSIFFIICIFKSLITSTPAADSFFPVGGTVVQANSGWGYFELQKRRTAVVLSVLVGGSLTSFLPPLLPSTLGFLNHRHTSHKSTQHIHHPHFISSHIRGVSSLLWQGLIGFSNQIDLESVSTSFLQKHIKMFPLFFFFFSLEKSVFLNPTSVFFFFYFFY